MSSPAAEHGTPLARAWRDEPNKLDVAVYAAIAATPTPAMDAGLRELSRAADHARLWVTGAALLAALGGDRGRVAATNGVASIALASAVVNLMLKPLGDRHRPDRIAHAVPVTRQVTMPRSSSWPSGHAASAFASGSLSETGVGLPPTAGSPSVVSGYAGSIRGSTTSRRSPRWT